MPGGFLENLLRRFRGREPDLDDIEEALLRADLGVALTARIIDDMRDAGPEASLEELLELARRAVLERLSRTTTPDLSPFPDRPKVILITGVNGSGKTTTAAKLANWLRARSHTVMFAAADTFRAAAIEQLSAWAQRLGMTMASSSYGADPAAVCFDAWQSARRKGIQFLLCDTAGRLHTKDNLMHQLAKIGRSLAKLDPTAPHLSFLVVDAGTGGNAVVQAREFKAAIPLSGVIMTKLDGSGRGGALVGIIEATGIPTVFFGDGEKLEDFHPFDPGPFVQQLL